MTRVLGYYRISSSAVALDVVPEIYGDTLCRLLWLAVSRSPRTRAVRGWEKCCSFMRYSLHSEQRKSSEYTRLSSMR